MVLQAGWGTDVPGIGQGSWGTGSTKLPLECTAWQVAGEEGIGALLEGSAQVADTRSL